MTFILYATHIKLYSFFFFFKVGEWSMREILRGSVALEENVLLCTDENLHWKNLTKDTQQRPPNHFNVRLYSFVTRNPDRARGSFLLHLLIFLTSLSLSLSLSANTQFHLSPFAYLSSTNANYIQVVFN